jgi:transcriptional regulator with XRE-family HTH domain
MTDTRTLLASNMKYYRKLLEISQMVLAARVGCSTTLIGNIEIKKCFPSPKNLDRIAAALEVSPSGLFAENSASVIPVELKKARLKQELEEKLDKKVLDAIKSALNESWASDN